MGVYIIIHISSKFLESWNPLFYTKISSDVDVVDVDDDITLGLT